MKFDGSSVLAPDRARLPKKQQGRVARKLWQFDVRSRGNRALGPHVCFNEVNNKLET